MCSESLLDVFSSSFIFPFDNVACSMPYMPQFCESIFVKINKAELQQKLCKM